MKRVLAIFALLVILAFPLGAAAERIDVSDLSLDALIMLKTRINEEINERTKDAKDILVPVGEYIIGADIPSGTYTITNRDSWLSIVAVYDTNGDCIKSYSMIENESIGKIVLQYGQSIKINSGSVYFSIYKGLGF